MKQPYTPPLIVQGIALNDLLMNPGYCAWEEKDVSLETRLTNKIRMRLPFFPAPMSSTTEYKLCIASALEGIPAPLHRNMPIEEQVKQLKKVKAHPLTAEEKEKAILDSSEHLMVGAAVGARTKEPDNSMRRVEELVNNGVDYIIIDTAHGHNQDVLDFLKALRKSFGDDLQIIAGNIATGDAARFLLDYADAVRVGIGPASVCTTRLTTKVGVYQASALLDIVPVAKEFGKPVISDAGLQGINANIAVALALGADVVMNGSRWGACKESPTPIIEDAKGNKLKPYWGMASMKEKIRRRQVLDLPDDGRFILPEGDEGYIPYFGTVHEMLTLIEAVLRRSFCYAGARDIPSLQTHTSFSLVSPTGTAENASRLMQLT